MTEVRKLMECPQWMDAHTSFEIVWEPNDALQQIISQLDLQQVPYEVSSKKFKVKARLTSFVDYCDFTICLFAHRHDKNKIIMEMDCEMGSKNLFFEIMRMIANSFHVFSNTQLETQTKLQKQIHDMKHDLYPITNVSDMLYSNSALTKEEQVLLWNQTCTQLVTNDCLLDMQFQLFQALTLLTFQLPLSSIYHLIDTIPLRNIILMAVKSKDLEIVRFGGMILEEILQIDSCKEIWKEPLYLLFHLYQYVPKTFRTSKLLKDIIRLNELWNDCKHPLFFI